jgi:CO/xanthine dehydrogenase FAD-binding subunit
MTIFVTIFIMSLTIQSDVMPNPHLYYRPKTLDEALHLTTQPGAIALAGGALTFGQLALPYEILVDLQDVPELKQIDMIDNTLHIGGAVILQNVIDAPQISPALKRSLLRGMPLNLRNNTSVGESLLSKDAPGEWLAALVALGARVVYVGRVEPDFLASSEGEPLEAFIAYVASRRAQGEEYQDTVLSLHIPQLPERSTLGMAQVARTPADAPIVNAAVWTQISGDGMVEAAVAVIGGASDLPIVRLELSTLIGNPLDEANIASAVKAVAPQVNPVGDYRGSADYRREMARLMVQRALLDCREQLL